MLMEGQVNFFSPQNTAGVSQENTLAGIYHLIAVNGDWALNVRREKKELIIKP